MDPARQSQELLDVSASMRTALLVYSGITLKMMVDSDLGAVLSSMFMVQYEPHGAAGLHDHPLEETYLILDGDGRGDVRRRGVPPGAGRRRLGGRRVPAQLPQRATGACAGWRPRRRRCRRGTATGSRGTGTTCGNDSREDT